MGNYPQTFVTNTREFSVKFPAKQNVTLKNFLGTSSRVPLLFPAMVGVVHCQPLVLLGDGLLGGPHTVLINCQ